MFSSDVLRVFQACVLHASKAMCRDRHVFFMGFKGDVPRVFLACVLHASGTNPAAVRGFRRRFSKAMAIELFSSDVLRVFQACVLHASKAMCRDRHVFFYGFQR